MMSVSKLHEESYELQKAALEDTRHFSKRGGGYWEHVLGVFSLILQWQ